MSTFDLVRTFIVLAIFVSCNPSSENEPTSQSTSTGPQFESIDATVSGLDFVNLVEENDTLNYYRFMHLYTGAGVASGDLNNDQLPDLYFVSNLGQDRCYLNQGDLKFSEISTQAGIGNPVGFSTGVTMADVNNDGWLDIYVCRSGWFTDARFKRNLLYINNGDATFTENAAAYGLADESNSIQASFFDYDHDGDLDMYLVNTAVEFRFTSVLSPLDQIHASQDLRQFNAYDKLYRNDGSTFTDVTTEAGILSDFGFGLSLITSDFNQDGWTDIYVANDFMTPDYLYLNQGDGTFKEARNDFFRHTSFYSMGSDAADINNDGLTDLFVLDMLPEDYKRSKTTMEMVDPESFFASVEWGYNYQYMHNMLHLNNGNGSFREIAHMAGVTKTDWSWSPLIADFDNDGYRDIFVTNGIKRDVTERDHKAKIDSLRRTQEGRLRFSDVAQLIPSQKIPNYLFHNNGDLTFTDISEAGGIAIPSFSNGSILADLDQDGDLDLVTNNVNDPAFLFENKADQNNNHWLQLQLTGTPEVRPENAQVELLDQQGKILQYAELLSTRGYHSRSETILHFGLGQRTNVERINVYWSDGRVSTVENVQADQRLNISASTASTLAAKPDSSSPIFTEIAPPSFLHSENTFDDFAVQILLPHRQSQNGPAIAVGDVNGDGLEDLYLGGAHQQTGVLYLQNSKAGFSEKPIGVFDNHRNYEDLGSTLFDADGDGDLDLYVVSGGNEFPAGAEYYQDRLYLNDGQGNFSYNAQRLPEITSSGSCVKATDFDGDGDLDLFVGGRVTPDKYPFPPQSYLLINDGSGTFTDKTSDLAPSLPSIGMVTDASWVDFNADGLSDLVLTGEWLGIEVFENQNGKLARVSPNYGLENTVGWWNSLLVEDLDADGDLDIIAGNLGTNYKFTASPDKPFLIYCDDFDQNGTYDIVLAKKIEDAYFPVRGRTCSSEQMPFIESKFPTFEAWADADLEDIYGQQRLESALHFEARTFESSIFWNEGGTFRQAHLPREAQTAPVNGMIYQDFDGDGINDLLVAGNHHGAEVETTRADAGIGTFLRGTAEGFQEVSLQESGFFASGDVKHLETVQLAGGGQMILVINNNDSMQAFRVNSAPLQ